MAGTRQGGQKAREKNLAKDPDYYRNIGRKGGSKSSSGGFASDKIGKDGLTGRERASAVGQIGGLRSKRSSGGLKGFQLHYKDEVDENDL